MNSQNAQSHSLTSQVSESSADLACVGTGRVAASARDALHLGEELAQLRGLLGVEVPIERRGRKAADQLRVASESLRDLLGAALGAELGLERAVPRPRLERGLTRATLFEIQP